MESFVSPVIGELPFSTHCIGGLEYSGRMTRLTCDRIRSFSSAEEQTIEKVPARSPYKPRFWEFVSGAALQTSFRASFSFRHSAHLCEGLTEDDLVSLLDKMPNSKCITRYISRSEALISLDESKYTGRECAEIIDR